MPNHVKIALEISPDDKGHTEIETVWALPCNTGYKIDNIPFYANNIALGDIVNAKEDKNGLLIMEELFEASGHSTIRIWFSDAKYVQSAREDLRRMGCSSELSDLPRLIAVDVPPTVPYESIQEYLDGGKRDGKWDYQEGCLGFL